jgi:membrane-bound metal-dependent hydrolase YbcI (DUF457 family)
MNYLHHAFIGVGTASLGVAAAEILGAPKASLVTLAMGGVIVAAAAIAPDLDHPKSFISYGIPSRVIRFTLAILAIPLMASMAVFLGSRDPLGSWHQVSGMFLGWSILRWSLIILGAALSLMAFSWLLYKKLHHRGPLHSLVVTFCITLFACLLAGVFGQSWTWGLAFGWGWLWHILADGLTSDGVPFLWPFSDDREHTLPVWICGTGRFLLSLLAGLGFPALLVVRIIG